MPATFAGQTPKTNILEFIAVANPTTLITPTGIKIGSLKLQSNGKYEVGLTLNTVDHLPTGTTLRVLVKANFIDGTSINEWKTITLNSGNFPNTFFTDIIVDLRGNPSDYNPNQVNYLIEIYK